MNRLAQAPGLILIFLMLSPTACAAGFNSAPLRGWDEGL